MTRAESLAKALSAVGQGTVYDISQGIVGKACSCSRFIAWALDTPVVVNLPLYRRWNGGWFETTAIYRDAKSELGLFTEVPSGECQPGDLLVWPDSVGKQGHVGMVTAVADGHPTKVVHCSRGNWRRTGDAVRETDTTAFAAHQAIVARWHGFDDEEDEV